MNILIHSFIKIFCGVAASDTNKYSKIKAIINRQVLVKSKKKMNGSEFPIKVHSWFFTKDDEVEERGDSNFNN